MGFDETGELASRYPRSPVTRRPLTGEDLARSRDRSRVQQARTHRSRWYLLWLLVGPGILAMLGENDGPSMISYTATGAVYGIGFFLPFIVVDIPDGDRLSGDVPCVSVRSPIAATAN